ncbi:hypothetical protein [Microbulbifer sp. ALW1]|uniref:head-tail joining protein n=1 Tax=Microbulbifer sp. (strain ALW1) TaxID=1516059 RepID=UPI001357DD66|nr:hypothetical protein [Microbulbifer sp. ALW1]
MAGIYTELIDPDLPDYVEAEVVASGATLPGIFTDAWQEAAQQAGTIPVLTCDADTAAMMGATEDAELLVRGASYIVREIQPRNGGGASLVLELQ